MEDLSDLPLYRTCTKCGVEKPVNYVQWVKVSPAKRKTATGGGKGQVNGDTYSKCRACLREEKTIRLSKAKDRHEAEAITRQLHELALLKKKQWKILELALNSTDVEQIPHIAEILEAMMSLLGGPRGYALTCVADLYAAEEGGVKRMQWHKAFQALCVKVTESGAAKKPLESMEDDELAAEFERRQKMRLRIMAETGQVHDVPESEPMTLENNSATG